VKHSISKRLRNAKRRIERRLDGPRGDQGKPMFATSNLLRIEWAERVRGVGTGGIGLVHRLAQEIGLVAAIDRRLHLLKIHMPYHESDHVLNLAYNALCDGTRLEDIELRRNDEVFLDALGTERIPDPTTAGDFCRRFGEGDIRSLMRAADDARLNVWAKQSKKFFDRATIDLDGTLVVTTGECKAGMDISYKGTWGYHPLLVSLAETGEVLRLVNRPGNRPSHEGAAEEADEAIALCRRAGFRKIVLRKNISHEKGQRRLFDEIRYFFTITNDWAIDAEDVVFEANDRCDQENLIAQLAGGVRALSAPVDNLYSNWAYMVATSLAWNLKAWWALWLPEQGRWREKHQAQKHAVLRMEFKTFLNAFIKIPCQIVRSGRQLIYRVLHDNPHLPVFFRLCRVLRC